MTLLKSLECKYKKRKHRKTKDEKNEDNSLYKQGGGKLKFKQPGTNERTNERTNGWLVLRLRRRE